MTTKTRILSIITIAIMMASCGSQKQAVKEDALKKVIAEKDENNKIPIISSATLLTPENYETEKLKFIELIDYVVNTAEINPEYKF